MQGITMRLFAIFIVAAILKVVAHMTFGIGAIGSGVGILIDIALLGYVYVVLKEYHYLNVKKIMGYLGGITAISILAELGVVRSDVAQVIILLVIAWMLFGKGGFLSSGGRGRY